MLIVIDGDTVAYRAAFAAQRVIYTLVDTEEGMPVKEFKTKKELNIYLEENEELVINTDIEKGEKLEPLNHALQNSKTIMTNIIEGCKNRFGNECEAITYLSGPDNFRKHVSTFEPYKGHRPKSVPVHLKDVKEYLENTWNAVSEANIEADDLMAITAYAVGFDNVVLVTTDKDLNQVPGWHYNFVKKEFKHFSWEEADKFFWTQMLTGDPTDNVVGIVGVGDIRAKRILNNCTDVDSYRQAVFGAYSDKYGPDEGRERFVQTYALLRLLSNQDEIERVRANIK